MVVSPIVDFSILMLFSLLLLILMNKLKQPSIFAYVLTGVIASFLFNINLESNELINLFSHLGIALLLFIIGLHLELDSILRLDKKILFLAFGQVIFTFALSLGIFHYLNFSIQKAIVYSIALTFSSTIIVAKIMSDLKQLKSLHAKIDILILILQDIFAIFAIVLVQSISSSSLNLGESLRLVLNAFALIFSASFLYFFFYKRVLPRIAKNTEALFIISLSFPFLMMILSHYLGTSLELGAFLAGLMLSSTPFSHEVYSRTNSLKEFFLLFFFISVGSSLSFEVENFNISLFSFLLFFVLIIKPLIIYILMYILSFDNRTSFLASINMAQLSEFGLIVLEKAHSFNIVSRSEVSLFSLLVLSTMLISSYFMFFSSSIFNKLERILPERKSKEEQGYGALLKEKKPDIVIVGLHTLGYTIFTHLDKKKYKILVIDFDPDVINSLRKRGYDAVYGDILDNEIINFVIDLKPKIVISTIPSLKTNKFILKKIKMNSPNTLVFLTVNTPEESLELYKDGADYVILPHYLGGKHLAFLLEDIKTKSLKDFLDKKLGHIEELIERNKMKHKHSF